jgi:hypothetical protein
MSDCKHFPCIAGDCECDADPNEGCPNKGGHEWTVEETEDGSEGHVYCAHCRVGGYL